MGGSAPYLDGIKTELHLKPSNTIPKHSYNFLLAMEMGGLFFFTRSGQITIIPKPELRGFWGDSPTKPPFGVTSAEVAIICPDQVNQIKQAVTFFSPN